MNLRLTLFIIIITLVSCKKDKLTNEYSSFKGSYEWTKTPLNNKNIFSNTNYSLTDSTVGYSVSFSLNDKGEAFFYKNGELISQNKYSITDKENTSPGNSKISIKLKGKTGIMVISKNTLTLRLSGDTLLSIDEFPFPAIDNVEKYKPGFGHEGNLFSRK